MRIFYASSTTPNAEFASDLWRRNLYCPLVDLGHDVVEFQYDLRETFRYVDTQAPAHRTFIAENRPRVSAELLGQVTEAHRRKPIDVFFSYFYDACVLPETIDRIKSMGITTVNWYCNGSYQLHLASQISPHYDWCLVPEKFRLDDYRKMGARPIYCQEAANPNYYRPYDVKPEFDVVFVGQAYGERPAYIRFLIDKGIDVHVWGPGWEPLAESGRSRLRAAAVSTIHTRAIASQGWQTASHTIPAASLNISRLLGVFDEYLRSDPVGIPDERLGGLLADDDMVRMYSRAKINIGFSTCGDTHAAAQRIVQVRLRDFEIPMSGGFYMVEYMEELSEFYKIGEEIVCYRNREDLADKIRYYLSHDAEREQVRMAGYRRCRADHTWHRRFTDAFREMGLH